MAKIKGKQNKLSKKEEAAQKFIKLGFKPHKGAFMKTAKKILDAYNGKYAPTLRNRDIFKVNTIASLANLLLPNFVFDSPYIRVRPLSSKYFKQLVDGAYMRIDNVRAAEVREAAVNYKYTQIDAVGEQRKSVLDSFFYGFGVTKVGYGFETITEDDKDYVLKDTPYLKRVNPRDFGWHPLATGLDDSMYLVHRSITTLDKLKKRKRYKNLDQIREGGTVPDYVKDKMGKGSDTEGLDEFLSIYEVHDQSEDMIYTFASEDHILIDKNENPYKMFHGPHFSMIRFISDNENFEGIPLLNLVYDEAVALNEIMTLIVEHFRKFPGQLFINSSAADDDDIVRIRNGEQGSVHVVKDINGLSFKPPLNMGNEYFSLVNLFQNIMDRTLGVPDFQRLGSTTRKTATEATFVQGDASIRRQYALKLVKDFMVDGIEKLAALQDEFQDEKEFVRATGDLRGRTYEYDKLDLKYKTDAKPDADDAKFQFDFDIDSLKSFNEVQMNNLNNAMNMLVQNPLGQAGLRSIDSIKFLRMVFKGFGISLESLMNESPESSVFLSPEHENKIAREGKEPMPHPKKGEEHSWHKTVHTQDLRENGPNEAILEHLAETIMLEMEEQKAMQGAISPPPAESGGTPPPEGPQGPLQQ